MAVLFETERLTLRHYEIEDAVAGFDIYSRPEVVRTLRAEPMATIQAMHRRIEQWQSDWGSLPYGVLAATLRDNCKLIGTCILKPLPGDTRFEVGWHVHPQFWGQGLATEFGRAAISYGWSHLSLESIHAILLPENAASRRVALKCDLQFAGLTRQFHELELEFYSLNRPESLFSACD